MNIDEILVEWEGDAQVSPTQLGRESLKISELHHKYYKILVGERLLRRKLEADQRTLRLKKHELYTQGPSEETKAAGWRAPQARVLRQDVQIYTDADEHLQDLSLRIGYQNEKIDLLESIIKTLGIRNYVIKNAIDWRKFEAGER